MASLKKMRNKWYARIRKWDGTKQRELQTVPLMTESKMIAHERIAIVNRVENDIKNGMDFTFPWQNGSGELKVFRLAVNEATDNYLKSRRTEGISPGSIRRYRISLNNLEAVVGSSLLIDSLTVDHIERFKSYWQGKHKVTGINIDLRHIKTFIKWCVDRSLLAKEPKVVMVKMPKPRPQYIPDAEYDKLAVVEEIDQHFRSAFDFYRATGCRQSEPFYGILDGNWLTIPAEHTKARVEKELHLSDDLVEIWKDMKSRFDSTKYQARNFIGRYGKEFAKACKAVGLDYHFHNLRHTFAVRRYLQTRDIYLVKKEMGHASVTTTEVYAEFSLRKLAEDFPSITDAQNRGNQAKNGIRDTDFRDTK